MNEKIEKMDNLQFVINELITNIKQETSSNINTQNVNINELEKNVKTYSHENTSHFNASYNIERLKTILNNLYNIIKEQDKRITQLESSK